MRAVAPIRREVVVDAGPQTAFEVFSGDIGRWWPVAQLSVYGAGATVTLADEEIAERSPDGRSALWGTITRWAPPSVLAFTWHPGQLPDRASHVEVTFTAAGQQTLVTLAHSGWDTFEDPAAARAEYDQGWPVVLDRYAGQVHQPGVLTEDEPGDGGETWVALLHRPGLVAALRREAPQVRVTGIAAGLHVLCELPPGLSEKEAATRAAARGPAVAPLAPYRVAGQHDRPALIVGYGTPPEHAFSGAVARLCAVLSGAA